MKRIVVHYPDGRELELKSMPSLTEMRRLLDGSIEHVRVVDHIEPVIGGFRPVYTSMFVNETGLIDGLPRNPKATELYQRNVRLAYPDASNPFKAASEAWRKSLPEGSHVTDLTPAAALDAGYKDDPWIAGPAIVFEGWTCEEVDGAMS